MVKSKLKKKKNIKVDYPCLMTSRGKKVVLMSSPGVGVVVYNEFGDPEGQEVGHYATNWAEECFEPFEGTLELKNKKH